MWVAVGIIGAAVVGGVMADKGADAAADASVQGANIQADYQREALAYLKETEEIPQLFREEALKGIAGAYNIEGGAGSQRDLIDRALASPLYGSIMGGQEAGEDAILRNAAATGGFRSGNVQHNMYDYNVQLQNRALLESYNQQMQGLQGLAMLPSNANQIAQQTSEIGTTYGQGIIAAGQAQQQGYQNMGNNVMGAVNLGISAYDAGMFSDRRLKINIKKIGLYKGFNIYAWDWNIVANKMGLTGSTIGCMADEVYPKVKSAVSIKNLFMFVDYSKIGILL
jgi:hypothetical protein